MSERAGEGAAPWGPPPPPSPEYRRLANELHAWADEPAAVNVERLVGGSTGMVGRGPARRGGGGGVLCQGLTNAAVPEHRGVCLLLAPALAAELVERVETSRITACRERGS